EDPRYPRLLAATRRAAAKGYDAVSMRALASETRMSLATIYELVGSKDELIARAHAGGMERFREQVAKDPPVGTTPAERVRAVLERFVAALEGDEVRTRTLMRALYSPDPRVASSRRSVGLSWAAIIDTALGDAEVADREDVTDVLGHVMNSVILQWLNGRLDIDEVR